MGNAFPSAREGPFQAYRIANAAGDTRPGKGWSFGKLPGHPKVCVPGATEESLKAWGPLSFGSVGTK